MFCVCVHVCVCACVQVFTSSMTEAKLWLFSLIYSASPVVFPGIALSPKGVVEVHPALRNKKKKKKNPGCKLFDHREINMKKVSLFSSTSERLLGVIAAPLMQISQRAKGYSRISHSRCLLKLSRPIILSRVSLQDVREVEWRLSVFNFCW